MEPKTGSLAGKSPTGVAAISNPPNHFALTYHLLLCPLGIHRLPARREPSGPITAECPCCHKIHYCYGLDVHTRGIYMSLYLPNYPRVLGTIAAVEAGQRNRH